MKTILIFSLFFAPLSLANDTQIEVDQLWQEYAEPSMQDEFLTETEAESRKSAPAREPELTRALLAHWESIMQQRRWCDGTYHWDGVRAYGAISYRTQDLPHLPEDRGREDQYRSPVHHRNLQGAVRHMGQ